jgi:hypothetical protein
MYIAYFLCTGEWDIFGTYMRVYIYYILRIIGNWTHILLVPPVTLTNPNPNPNPFSSLLNYNAAACIAVLYSPSKNKQVQDTRQDKTRQFKTRNSRQNETRQDKTR